MAANKTAKPVKSKKATSNDSGKKSKKPLIIGLVVGLSALFMFMLFVLVVIIGLLAGSSVETYKTSDLVPVSNSDISFTRPKQWVDASYVDKLNEDFGFELSNPSAYGDKIVTDKNGQTDVANAFVIFGKTSSEKTDVAVLSKSEFKTKFEELMGQQLSKDKFESDLCEDVSNYGINYNYDFNGFPVSVAIKFNCQIADDQKNNYDADSLEVRMAMVIAKDSNTYVYMLVATDESWAKNEPVYLNMLEDFKAK